MGCNEKPPIFGPGGGGDGSDGGGDDGPNPDTGPTPDTGDTGGGQELSFDDPGDVVDFVDETGRADVVLADASGESNQGQEFYSILVNTGSSDIGYEMHYEDSGAITTARSRRGAAAPSLKAPQGIGRSLVEDAVLSGDLARPARPLPAPPLADGDVGTARTEFRVRASAEDDTAYSRVYAKLWGLGDKVAIWVDVDVPIDWDYTCDGVVDVVDNRGAYGFDNCDLQKIADIFDTNIYPHVSGVFGEVSDINEDERVSVVITPVLNYMTQGLADEEDRATLVGSYAEPAIDLTDYDADSNPGSDEQEVIYVFAPDPYGFYNPFNTTTVDEYTSMELAAEIARALERLISYNMHILEGGTDEEEETWLNEGLGALAADLCGFGAVYYDDVWDYMDAPHLTSLVDTETNGDINSASWGAQYLYLRWVTDVYGPEFITQMMASGLTGKTNVESALGVFAEDVTFDQSIVMWQVALLTSGRTNAAGEPLVAADLYPPYQSPSFISAPTSSPTTGDYYGANGYQTGINVGGANYYFEDGTTGSPSENVDNRVLLSNTDHTTMVAGFPFYGYAAADYGAHVVRLTGIPYDGATVMIQGSSANYTGAVIRWEDPTTVDWVKETSFSSSEAGTTTLPTLPSDGSPIYGIGEVKDSVTTVIVAVDEDDFTDATVYDTDRWLLDLSSVSPTSTVTVAIHLNRQYTTLSGDMGLEDPWISVVPAAWLPNPTVSGTRSCSDPDALAFAYPTSVLDYLYYQIFLSTSASEAAGTADGTATDTGTASETFDPCGAVSTTATTCANDWDLDGVLDVDEPLPATFVEQVQVMQCTLAGGDLAAFTPVNDKIIDTDERDDDEESYYDRAANIGGKHGGSGEEAFLKKVLQGGQQYVVVVGATTGIGTYELVVKQLN